METLTKTDGLEQLLSLEEKIHRTIEVLKSTRAENTGLRRELQDRDQQVRSLQERLRLMESERDTVRGRIERLLQQVDSLTNAEAESQ